MERAGHEGSVKAVLAALLVLSASALFAQDAPAPDEGKKPAQEESTDLRRFADDVKYQNAAQFFQIRDYARALAEFREYLEIYIRGAHRNEAYRNIAKIYFDRYDYERSVHAYNAIYEESSTSEEGIDAYYRMGLCFQKMGEDARAQAVFSEIVQKYPYSNCRQLAQIQLDMIKIFSK